VTKRSQQTAQTLSDTIREQQERATQSEALLRHALASLKDAQTCVVDGCDNNLFGDIPKPERRIHLCEECVKVRQLCNRIRRHLGEDVTEEKWEEVT